MILRVTTCNYMMGTDCSLSSDLQLSSEDQQVLQQWLTKANDIVTFILHCTYRSETLNHKL